MDIKKDTKLLSRLGALREVNMFFVSKLCCAWIHNCAQLTFLLCCPPSFGWHMQMNLEYFPIDSQVSGCPLVLQFISSSIYNMSLFFYYECNHIPEALVFNRAK